MENFFIDKYNFSRRVVDHRVPHDLNHAMNQPHFTRPWMIAFKQNFVGKFLQGSTIYMVLYMGFIGIGIGLLDATHREFTEDQGKSILFHPQQQWGQRFNWNHLNKHTNLGRWNHNFYCWEKEPNCGRDFD